LPPAPAPPLFITRAALKDGPGKYSDLAKLKADVVAFARQFPTVGF
jgi:hypothetical protein